MKYGHCGAVLLLSLYAVTATANDTDDGSDSALPNTTASAPGDTAEAPATTSAAQTADAVIVPEPGVAAPVAAPATAPAAAATTAHAPSAPAAATTAVAQTANAAAIAPPSAAELAQFPRPALLQSAIAFWGDVFRKYSENESVIHAYDDPGRVYMVLDYRERALTLNAVQLDRLRRSEEREALAHVDTLLKQVDALQATPERMNPEQKRIWALFEGDKNPHRFRAAIGNSRVQHGLRERTEHALEVATSYLPGMEKTFAGYGLPPQLTRLPLVESSFNLNAYSRDGAAGIWQFIPSSARIYMRLNEIVDDRRDPWLSTDAAARHLRDDYKALNDWPLAVTAYNHGRGGIARGLVKVDGTSLSDLILRSKDPNFGFASRNFYAEFLAATDTERTWRARHPLVVSKADPIRFDVVTTKDYVAYDTLQKLAGVDADAFRTLNPAYRGEVVDGRLWVPPDHEIRVPAGAGKQFLVAYQALPSDERYTHQREFYLTHVVQRGDSLSKLAHRYGVSATQILAANQLKSAGMIRIGASLRIPNHAAAGAPPAAMPAVTTVAAAQPAAKRTARSVKVDRVVRPQYRTHTIKPGQTLSGIAKLYQTSVPALREANALGTADHLKVGKVLKIPVS